MIPDPFFYAERDERRIVVIGSMEIPRIEEAGAGLEAHPLEEFGADELLGRGSTPTRTGTSSRSASAAGSGSDAIVPRQFPLAAADELRRVGVELTVDRSTSTTGAE